MTVPMRIDEIGVDLGRYTLATVRAAHKAGLRATALAWRGQFAPRHFRAGAAQRYRYDKRRSKRGHSGDPLTESGDLRQAMLHGSMQLRVKSREVRMKFYGLPSYIVDGGGLMEAKRDAAVERLEAAASKATTTAEATRYPNRANKLRRARTVARYPNIRRELVAVTGPEAKELIEHYDRAARRHIQRAPQRKRRRRLA